LAFIVVNVFLLHFYKLSDFTFLVFIVSVLL